MEARPLTTSWIRQVTPVENGGNRSRRPTDQAWRVVQRAHFTDSPAPARRLIRRAQQAAHVHKLHEGTYGNLISQTARLHPHGGQHDLSMAVGEMLPALRRIQAPLTKRSNTSDWRPFIWHSSRWGERSPAGKRSLDNDFVRRSKRALAHDKVLLRGLLAGEGSCLVAGENVWHVAIPAQRRSRSSEGEAAYAAFAAL